MSRFRPDRLVKLAEHLEKGKLGHEVFDFGTMHAGQPKGEFCGSNGCALGECPVIWPEDFKFDCATITSKDDQYDGFGAAAEFFGLTRKETFHLFNPYDQVPALFGGSHLYGTASKEEVAENIRAFVLLRLGEIEQRIHDLEGKVDIRTKAEDNELQELMKTYYPERYEQNKR